MLFKVDYTNQAGKQDAMMLQTRPQAVDSAEAVIRSFLALKGLTVTSTQLIAEVVL